MRSPVNRTGDPSPSGALLKSGARVVRGGLWYGYARCVRAASRLWLGPAFRAGFLGFRFAAGQEGPPSDSRSGE